MPFLKTAPAATGRGVLGNENRVSAKRRLFAIVGDEGRYQSFDDEIFGMAEDQRQAFAVEIIQIFAAQVKTAAKI